LLSLQLLFYFPSSSFKPSPSLNSLYTFSFHFSSNWSPSPQAQIKMKIKRREQPLLIVTGFEPATPSKNLNEPTTMPSWHFKGRNQIYLNITLLHLFPTNFTHVSPILYPFPHVLHSFSHCAHNSHATRAPSSPSPEPHGLDCCRALWLSQHVISPGHLHSPPLPSTLPFCHQQSSPAFTTLPRP